MFCKRYLLTILLFVCFLFYSIYSKSQDTTLKSIPLTRIEQLSQEFDPLLVSINDLLVNFAGSGNYGAVSYLLEQGADPNYSDNGGVTALMYASDIGNFKIAKLLIEKGAQVNYKPSDGNTALFAAVRANNDSIVELLIQSKALVNEKNYLSLTPLHYAAGYGYPYMTKLLIDSGATTDALDLYGNTPLITSVYSGAVEATGILIDSGADVNMPDNKGNTPIMIASQFNDTTLITRLYIAGADINRFNNKKNNALSIAIANNSAEAFKLLIDYGANTDSFVSGRSYYQQAVEQGNSNISTFLRSKGLNTRLKPNISGINIYTGFSTSQKDFMVDLGGGVYESITKMLINFGYKYRPFSNRVLVYRNSLYYQFWEKRYSIYLSLQRFYTIKEHFSKGKAGFTPGLSNEITWRYYRGLNEGSGIKWILVPSIGLFYQKDLFTIIGKWEIAKYDSWLTVSNRFNLHFLLTIPTRYRVANKKINWLD